MTSNDRKENSDKLLESLGIPADDMLPGIEDHNYLLQSSVEVAKRILILTYLNCVASEPSLQQEVMMFLIREKLWDSTTADEKMLFHKPQLSEEDIDNIFWRKESIWMLLWSIGEVDDIGLPDLEVDSYEIFPRLPGFFESTAAFIQHARLRDRDVIFGQQDFYFRLNWSLRENPDLVPSLIRGVVHERDLALSWLTGILGEWI